MSARNIDPDVRALRGHACHYEAPDPETVADAADYTNCSGARADLGDDE